MSGYGSSTAGPQIKVVIDAPGVLPPAFADPNQLEMALLNLCVNARDAMPEGGTLRISTIAEKVGPGHRTKLPSGTYLCLFVADTGIGMDAAALPRATEPFFSTKGIGKGTGLGLSMVHGLASQLNGILFIQSHPGLGTNVELWLPRSGHVAVEVTSEILAPERPKLNGRVLLVDDEEVVRASTADMLSDLGYVVMEAESAEDALNVFHRNGPFGLLVTDHLMPGMTGTELARNIQASHPTTSILVVSGYSNTEGVAADLPRLAEPFRKDDLETSLAGLAIRV